MKILILSQHFWPETFRINDVTLDLRNFGHEVRVLTGKPNYPEGAIFAGYKAAGCMQDRFDGVAVHRVPLVPRGRSGAVRLAANYLSFIAGGSLWGPGLLGGWRPDVILVCATSPLLQAIVGIRIAKLTGAKLAIWVQDLWPESLSATGYVTNETAIAAVEKVVRWIYARSDLLIAQSDAFVAPIRALAGDKPIVVQPFPGDGIDAATDSAPLLRLRGKFRIAFAGNLGTVQSLHTVLQAADLLRGVPDIYFTLIGSGNLSAWLVEEVATRGLANVDLPGRIPPEAVPAVLAQADVLLVSLARQPILALTVPSKIATYFAMGKPVVASMDGEGARVVREAGAGIAAAAEDAGALAEAIHSLYRMPQAMLDAMGRAGRSYFEHHYDPAVVVPRLAAHLQALVEGQVP